MEHEPCGNCPSCRTSYTDSRFMTKKEFRAAVQSFLRRCNGNASIPLTTAAGTAIFTGGYINYPITLATAAGLLATAVSCCLDSKKDNSYREILSDSPSALLFARRYAGVVASLTLALGVGQVVTEDDSRIIAGAAMMALGNLLEEYRQSQVGKDEVGETDVDPNEVLIESEEEAERMRV